MSDMDGGMSKDIIIFIYKDYRMNEKKNKQKFKYRVAQNNCNDIDCHIALFRFFTGGYRRNVTWV